MPDGDHRNQVQESPIWEAESPGKGESQRGNQSNQFSLRPRMDQRSLVKVRPRCGIEYPVPSDSWVRTRVTRAMQAQMANRITRSW